MSSNDPEFEKIAPLDMESCWALLERVVASPQLRRAARMREFLMYVGRRSLKEGCDQIPEQEIGSEVFGRPASYDTNADNIVRVNATDLRKRVEAYFNADGSQEKLILDIPRGSYKPVFHHRTIAPRAIEPRIDLPSVSLLSTAGSPAVEVPNAASNGGHISDQRLFWLASVAIALLGIACGALLFQNHALRTSLYAWQVTPSVRSFWSGILDARPNTDVILADTSLALIEDITKQPISLDDYLSGRYVRQLQSQGLSQDRNDDLSLIVQRNYGSVGDFRVSQRITALDPASTKIHLTYARDYSPALIKKDNVILIGSRKSNPWVDLFAGNLNFTVEYDPNRFISYIKNHAPIAGEQEVYTSPPAPGLSSGYSVVAYLPNSNQGGKVLIIAGTGSEATEGAGEFVTSEAGLAGFEKMLNVTTLPYFEVLLKTTHLNGTPLDAKVVAYRTYPGR